MVLFVDKTPMALTTAFATKVLKWHEETTHAKVRTEEITIKVNKIGITVYWTKTKKLVTLRISCPEAK